MMYSQEKQCGLCRKKCGYNHDYTIFQIEGVEKYFHSNCFRCTTCGVAIVKTGSCRHM